jgi:hypothetical protein
MSEKVTIKRKNKSKSYGFDKIKKPSALGKRLFQSEYILGFRNECDKSRKLF